MLEASRQSKRLKPVRLELGEITEIVRGPNAPIPYTEVDDIIVEDPEYKARRIAAAEVFRKVMVKQLALTPRKEVFIFVHGFHNDFNDAAFAMAELWHFLGRIGVPIIYTWPAGHTGLFGYTYDRESSEFTVFHLRQILEYIASFPEVERSKDFAHQIGSKSYPKTPFLGTKYCLLVKFLASLQQRGLGTIHFLFALGADYSRAFQPHNFRAPGDCSCIALLPSIHGHMFTPLTSSSGNRPLQIFQFIQQGQRFTRCQCVRINLRHSLAHRVRLSRLLRLHLRSLCLVKQAQLRGFRPLLFFEQRQVPARLLEH